MNLDVNRASAGMDLQVDAQPTWIRVGLRNGPRGRTEPVLLVPRVAGLLKPAEGVRRAEADR